MRNRILIHTVRKLSGIIAPMLLVMLSPSVWGQSLAWETNYGGQLNESGYSIRPTSDSGYVALGSTYSFGQGDYDLYLLKLSSYGDTIFSRTYGGPTADYGYDIQPLHDGSSVIVGSTVSLSASGRDLLVMKIDAVGDVVWSKSYGGNGNDEGKSIRQTPDGGFIICGTTSSSGAGYDDVYLLKIDASGNRLWERTYGGPGGESGAAVRITPDGGFAMVGSTGSFGEGYSSIYFVRTDSSGDSLWATTYGGAKADFAYSLETTMDSGFAVVGWTSSFGEGASDIYVINIDRDGVQRWQQTYGGSMDERGYAIKQAADGGFIIGGTTESFGHGRIDVYVVCIDSVGNEDWTLSAGGLKSDYCRDIILENGSCVLIGHSYSYSAGGSDVYLLKVTTDQMTPVDDDDKQSLPGQYFLAQNYPNPFNMSTHIEFQVPRRTSARLSIYNLLGQLVRTWAWADVFGGLTSVAWDGTNSQGTVVSSGIYLYRLETAEAVQTRKMVLLK